MERNVMGDLPGRLLFVAAVGIFVGCSCSDTKLERGYRWYKRGATVHAITLFDEYIREAIMRLEKRESLHWLTFIGGYAIAI